jgi:hypothetical protein
MSRGVSRALNQRSWLSMKCPLCQNRKAKRHCPAKGQQICPVCCGTKREVEIDCPSNCVYLHNGREYESEKIARTGQMPARTPRLWDERFASRHYGVFLALWKVILSERDRFPELIDMDVQAALDALIQTYETLSRGIYYESLPSSAVQRSLYSALESLLDQPSKELDVSRDRLKTETILDCLRFQKELAASIVLPRPKSRAFLDHLEGLVSESELSRVEQPRIVLP